MSEIILITGPTQSGKTWLANVLQKAYHGEAVILDEPPMKGRFREIKALARTQRVIITTNDPMIVWLFKEKLPISRIIRTEIPQ